MTAPLDSSVPTKVLSTDHTFSFFSFILFLLLLIIAIMGVCSRKCLKLKIFSLFTILYSKINVNLRQFRLGNYLPMHIRENTDFSRISSSEKDNFNFKIMWQKFQPYKDNYEIQISTTVFLENLSNYS